MKCLFDLPVTLVLARVAVLQPVQLEWHTAAVAQVGLLAQLIEGEPAGHRQPTVISQYHPSAQGQRENFIESKVLIADVLRPVTEPGSELAEALRKRAAAR